MDAGTSVVAIGNAFPNITPFEQLDDKVQWYSVGNLGYVAGARTVKLPDLIGRRVAAQGVTANQGDGLRLGEGLSLSWTKLSSSGSPHVLGPNECCVMADAAAGPVTIQLPPGQLAQGALGRLFIIKKVDASNNAVTIQPATGDTIEYGSQHQLSAPGAYVWLVSDSQGNWSIVGEG